MDTTWEQVCVLASRQHGLLTWRQLKLADFSDHAISGLVERRVIRRVRRGVYSIVGSPVTWEQAVLASVLSVGRDALASHATAARLWRFRHLPEEKLELTVPRGRMVDRAGVVIHRTALRDRQDVARRAAIPCTSFERTLCDLTTHLSRRQLATCLDDGLRRKVCALRELERCAERLESGVGRHMTVIRSLLAERPTGYNPGGSESELRVLEVVRRAGLPIPVQQFELCIEGHRYFPDYVWPDRLVLAEYYGLDVHSLPSAVAYDNERLTALTAAGWTPLVFTDATSDAVIERTLRRVLSQDDGGSVTDRLGA